MGWNSWEAFRKELDENAFKAQVDAIVKLGLRDAGYTHFVIDGGWKVPERDAKLFASWGHQDQTWHENRPAVHVFVHGRYSAY